MRKKYVFVLCLLIGLYNSVASNNIFVDLVKPNIGSVHSRWFFYTPGAVPFGMAKLGPSTDGSYGNKHGWEAVGYDDRHSSIEGFPCFREFQVGGLMLQPIVGELKTRPGLLEYPDEGFRSRFDKKDEYATAGYYSVILKDYDVLVELTATKRVGFQRYTFPKSDESRIIFDVGNQLGESGEVQDAYIHVVDGKTVQGYIVTKPEYVKKYQPEALVKMYFFAKIDKEAESFNTFFRNGELLSDKEINGNGACVALNYKTSKREAINVKIGLSYTSIENAKRNLQSEAAEKGFKESKEAALNTWNNYLGRIKVEGGKKADKVKFYTGLFHALLGRGLASDVNGCYPMNNGGVGEIEKNEFGEPIHHHYNTDAIWGGFWNLTQLWTLAYPEYYSEWIQSQLLIYKETGWLGDGIANSKYVSGVGTNFVSLAIAAAYNCGIRDFDFLLAYEAALKNEITWENRIEGAGKTDVKQFVTRGYVPYADSLSFRTNQEGSGFGASHTLEYAFSSFAVAQFAKNLDKEEDYKMLMKLSRNWKNLFDSDKKLIRPRDMEGRFIEEFDPFAPWIGFQEGNAIQYTFYVPHDIENLIELVGEGTFNNRLDTIFINSKNYIFGGGTEIDAFSGLSALYNHGNQPNLHISWLFNFSGKPYLSQKWVTTICNEFYGVEPTHGYGFGQDEDQGQLGAWYVMSAMGLFDVKGLSEVNPKFQIGSPLFKKVTIELNNKYYPGDNFVIQRKGSFEAIPYIQKLFINRKEQDRLEIPFETIKNGGKLVVKIGKMPNIDFTGI